MIIEGLNIMPSPKYTQEQWWQYGTFFFALLCFIGFGFHHLGKFVTADEHYWFYERIPKYWHAWESRSYKSTFINDKPGVSLALVSGIGLLQYPDPASHMTEGKGGEPDRYDVANTEQMNIAFRAPIIGVNTLFLIILFFLLRKLLDGWTATWATSGIALSPTLVGISQIVNPDAILWSTGTLSLIAFLTLLKEKKAAYAILSGVFFGFALLAKYVANILPLFFMVAFLWHAALSLPRRHQESIRSFILQGVQWGWIFLLSAFVTVSILLPAIWVKPEYLFRITFGISHMIFAFSILFGILCLVAMDALWMRSRIFFLLTHRLQRVPWGRVVSGILLVTFLSVLLGKLLAPSWHIFSIPFDLKNLTDIGHFTSEIRWFEIPVLQVQPIIFSLPLGILFLAVFFWAVELFRGAGKYSSIGNTLSLFIIIYIVASIASNTLSTIRYSILLYPVVTLIAMIGLSRLILLLQNHTERNLLVTSILFSGIIPSLALAAPYYFNFTNSLLPKNNIITDAWGYGGYEAASYLNRLPNAHKLTIWSDYYGVCEFFVGTCFTEYKIKPGYTIDYYVLTRRGAIRYEPDHARWTKEDLDDRIRIRAAEYYRDPNPEWQLLIGNRPKNFVKVVKGKDGE